ANALSRAEQALEIPIKVFKEIVHVHNVSCSDRCAVRWSLGDGLVWLLQRVLNRIGKCATSERAYFENGVFWTSIAGDSSDVVATAALFTLHHQGPDTWLALYRGDIAHFVFAMTNDTAIELLQHHVL